MPQRPAGCFLLIVEFDARQAWAEWGSLSCANWLSWKCGLSRNAAGEHVRVARRLVELPELIEPFSRGEISFSKVRAIIRVATHDNIEDLIQMANFCTAAQPESITGAFERVARTVASEVTGLQHSRRFARWRYEDDGSISISARLDPEEGAAVINAIEAAVAAGESEERKAQELERTHSAECAQAAKPVALPDGALDGSPDPPSQWPELLEVTAPSTEPTPWEKKNADALVAVAHTFLEKGMPTTPASDRFRVVLHVDEQTLIDRAPLGLSEIEGGPIVMPETSRRLCCDSSVLPLMEREGKPLSYGRSKRTVPPPLRRAIRARDKCCRFPGCTRRRVEIHHIEHWIEGGETEPENLASLCWVHHRLVHEGNFKMRNDNGRFRFYRPDGTYLPPVPQEAVPDMADLVALTRELGVEIGSHGPGGHWDGEHLTFDALSSCVDALLLADGLTTEIVEKMRDEHEGRVAA